MLSKGLNLSKLKYPFYLSEKFDGVPGIYTVNNDGITCISRQGTPITSTPHIIKELKSLKLPVGTKVIGEHYINGLPFSEISGKVRAQAPCKELKLYVFDVLCNNENTPFKDRYLTGKRLLRHCNESIISVVSQHYVTSHDMHKAFVRLIEINAQTLGRRLEGFIYRNADGLYKYTRSWDCMKLVLEPTVDLKVVDLIEAVDKNNEKLGRVGSLVCVDKNGNTFNISAGKSTFQERERWLTTRDIVGKIIVVKFKPDAEYKGLRQPTFQHIHEDKTEPDEVV